MKKHNLESELINKLKLNLQNNKTNALNEFLDLLNKEGNPIIEPMTNEPEYSLVTIIYYSEEPTNNVLIITQVLPSLTNDNIKEHLLEPIEKTNLFYITLKIRNDIKFSYNLFPNDSLILQCDKRVKNMKADKYNKNKLTFNRPNTFTVETPFVNMPKCKKDYWSINRSNIPKGKLTKYEFESNYFKELRPINIYTPYNYNHDSTPYGYLTLTDGYDYINILKAINVLDNLIYDNKIPPIVAIFIDSTSNRFNDLSCNSLFCNTVAKELIPWVRDRYNLSIDPRKAIIGGVSLGGLNATYMVLLHSDVFGNVLCNSGSFWYKPKELESNISNENTWISSQFILSPKLPLKFYINVGVLENEQTMINTTLNLRDTLESLNYSIKFEYFNSGHDYLSWDETLANGLISLIGY